MDFVIPIITPIVEYFLVPVKRHLGFLVSSSNYVRDMHAKVRELNRTARAVDTKRKTHNANSIAVPDNVAEWLVEAEKLKAREDNIATTRGGCFNIKMRYKAGKQSYVLIKDIDNLVKVKTEMVWTNEIIPLAMVSPSRPTTSTILHDQNNIRIKSRDLIFNVALKSLESNNNKNQKMALCGMGGVGKTTMMEQLEKVARDRNMFDSIVKVNVGQNPNPIDVQKVVAEYTGKALTETTKDVRAQRLQKRFKEMSEEGKKKILVILDDVWEEFNLNDIGLASPFSNGFKLLLTSREETVCTQMGVEASSIFKVAVLEDFEAKTLFWEIAGLVSGSYIEPDLHHIGEEIVKGCGGLPIAIKTIASTLRDNKEKYAWEDALFRLQNKEFRFLDKIFEISYNNLKEDYDRTTFLLCALFAEDYIIDIEDLLRYEWGLKVFKNVHTISQARSRVNTCVYNLIRSNLLIKSDCEGCVKMHDLVRDFVLRNFLKFKQASIMNHVSEALVECESYERISLRCGGMFEFPTDFNYPNLTFLMLMDGYNKLKFPKDFYTTMKKLEVVTYVNMHQPLLPRCLTNLRALVLRSCHLVDNDISFLGDLINLEVLSLVHCYIHKIPSKIGQLKRLKLLDLTGCDNLRIDDNVFRNLEKLEELYMRVFQNPIRFTDTNCDELKILSSKLIALELEFFRNKAQPKHVSFEKLERFKISMGRLLENGIFKWGYTLGCSFNNTLKLVTSRRELLECKINELFGKTDVLYLKVNDMSYVEDILVHPSHRSFCNLKALYVSECASLTFLFTIPVAKGLTKLEILEIRSCHVLKSVVHGENRKDRVITFEKLKYVSLYDLPWFASLCDTASVVELPQLLELHLDLIPSFTSIFSKNNVNIHANQPLLNKEVELPKLEKLTINNMKSLREIWPSDVSSNERKVNNIPMLREIEVLCCNSLLNIFPRNPMQFPNHLEKLTVQACGSIEVLLNIDLTRNDEINSGEKDIVFMLREIRVEDCHSLVNLFPCNPMGLLSHFENLIAIRCSSIKELFKIDLGSDYRTTSGKEDDVFTVREIRVEGCDSLVNIFPSTPMRFLSHLENLTVQACGSIEVLFNIDFRCESNITSFMIREVTVENCRRLVNLFPENIMRLLSHLEKLTVIGCGSIKELFNIDLRSDCGITSGEEDNVFVLREIIVAGCDSLVNIFPSIPTRFLSHLEKLTVHTCNSIEFLFNVNCDDYTGEADTFFMLREIRVEDCCSLVSLFLKKPMKLLSNLEELIVKGCGSIEVLFDIDLGCDDTIGQLSSSIAGCIKLEWLKKLRAVWKINDAENHHHCLLICGFQDIESIEIECCERFRNIVTPATTAHVDIRALIRIKNCGEYWERKNELVEHNQEQEVVSVLKEDTLKVGALMPILALPSYKSTLNFHHLHKVELYKFQGLKVVFEIESPSNQELVIQQSLLLLPSLQYLHLKSMDTLTHVWKCNNWNAFYTHHIHQPQSSFGNLTTITLRSCKSIKYLFSPLMMKLLSKLKKINLLSCAGMEEVVSNRDDEDDDIMASTSSYTTTTFFPYLCLLKLYDMDNLMCIGGGVAKCMTNVGHCQSELFSQVDVSWSLCQYSKEIRISGCHALPSVIPPYAAGRMQELQMLSIKCCNSIVEIFETMEIKNNSLSAGCSSTNIDPGSVDDTTKIPQPRNITIHKFPNLKTLVIHFCCRLENIFTFSTLESLCRLETLTIRDCKAMKVIVREEHGEQTTISSNDMVLFPHLKSIELARLPNLEGFFLGMNTHFQWPSLDYVMINDCPKMIAFASGRSTTPRLKYIHTELGKHNLECGLNYYVTSTLLQKPSTSLDPLSSTLTIYEEKRWSFHNLIECNLDYYNRQKIFPPNKLQHLQKLEIIHARHCWDVEEVFEVAMEATNNESQNVVKLSQLREVELNYLFMLKSLWKSNHWTVLEFPNLTKLSINECSRLEHVFTCSMVSCVRHLKELHIRRCINMEVIVKEEDCDDKVSEIKFPCLKSLKLETLSSLEGFCLWQEDCLFSSLDTLDIVECPLISVFIEERSDAPKLIVIETRFGSFTIGEDIDFLYIHGNKQEGFSSGEIDCSYSEDDV